MKDQQLHELLFQAIGTEQGGVGIDRTATGCASNDDLRGEWEKYLEQTERHASVLRDAIVGLGLDPEPEGHLNWELLGARAEKATGAVEKSLAAAVEEVEDEEDQHPYHTTAWSRELWIDALGLPAVLPPPEEEEDAKTAIGAARAESARARML